MRDGFYYKFWVYILSSRAGTLYTGITGFFEQRIQQHKYDSVEGFTKKTSVSSWCITKATGTCKSRSDAKNKSSAGVGKKKIALIEKMNPRWQNLAENWGREIRFRGQSLGRTP